MRWLIGLAGLLAIGAAPAPRTIAPATFVEWKAENGPRTFRSGDVTVRVAVSGKDGDSSPAFTISAPGVAPLRIVTDDGIAHYPSNIGIGPLVRGAPASVIVQTYSGGAHCCMHIAVALREGKHSSWSTWAIGTATGSPGRPTCRATGSPTSSSSTTRFLYAFGSYAGSYPPPLIMNIRGGKPIDVSPEPAFRPLFEKRPRRGAQRRAWSREEPNAGACAAWAADAARLGQFDAAWPPSDQGI